MKGYHMTKSIKKRSGKYKFHNTPLIWLWKATAKYKVCVAVLSLLQIIIGICSVIFAVLFRDLIDSATSGEQSRFFRTALLLICLEAGQIILDIFSRFLSEWTSSVLENRFKSRLFSCLLLKDYGAVTAIHSGEWMTRLTSDTVITANSIIEIFPQLAGIASRLAGALTALFFLEPAFFQLFIPAGILILLVTSSLRRLLKHLHKQIQEANGAVLSFLQERLENLMIIKVFSMEEQIHKEASLKMEHHKAARMKRNRISSLCNSGFGAVIDGGYLFGAIYCGYGILKGSVSYGTFMAVLQLIGQIQSRFAGISGIVPQYYAMLASTERLMEIEEYEDEEKEIRISQAEVSRFYREDFWSIGVRNAVFCYRSSSAPTYDQPQKPVIDHFNLEIRKGEYVAFTGHSGCGKSTLLKLLMCLFPLNTGERYLKTEEADGTHNKWPLTSAWRGLFAYVPQGNYLTSGTIREILAFGNPKTMIQTERLLQALKIACADEFVLSLENGLDTQLGEHGCGLSEGQMQRISIARAVFSDRPILILDEATSSLDEFTEQKLLTNMRQMTDKTVLIITHRPAALQICDRRIDMA